MHPIQSRVRFLQTATMLSLFILSCVVIHVQAQLPDGWSSLGCYTDASTRTLDAQSYSSSEMTPQTCISYCSSRDFTYAGVEYARECYCDNVLHNPGAPTDSGCNMACTGDNSQVCGGPNRINVYSSNNTPTTPSIKQTVDSWIYKGCHVDVSPRSLTYRLDTPPGANSAEYCTSQCKQYGYALAGLEYGGECWCDNYMPYGDLVDDNQCNMVCAGDNSELCGAGFRLALYEDVTATPPSPDTCLSGRDGSSFDNTGIQVIPKQGNVDIGLQMFVNTLDPSTDGSVQHSVITSCKTCPYSSNDALLYNFRLHSNQLSPHGMFGNPVAIAPAVGEPLTFLGYSNSPAFDGFCAMPNPVSSGGPAIGFPLLAAGGRTDLWSICPMRYDLENCREVYLQLMPEYARTDA